MRYIGKREEEGEVYREEWRRVRYIGKRVEGEVYREEWRRVRYRERGERQQEPTFKRATLRYSICV